VGRTPGGELIEQNISENAAVPERGSHMRHILIGAIALLAFTRTGAFAEELPKCEDAVKVWSNHCAGTLNTLNDNDQEWQSCVIEKMEWLGFRFPNDFVNVGSYKFVCY